MKTLFIIIILILSLNLFSQDKEVLLKSKQHFIGINTLSLISYINNPDLSYSNYTLQYKIIRDQKLNLQTSISLINNQKAKQSYSFYNESKDFVVLTKEEYDAAINIRFGIGQSYNTGLGRMCLRSNLIIGYLKNNKDYLEFVSYKNENNETEGYGSGNFVYSSIGYFTTGIDVEIAYEIDLNKHFTLGIEYVPELIFLTKVSEENNIENNSYDYFVASNFRNIRLNIFYRF